MAKNTIQLPAVRSDLTIKPSSSKRFPYTVIDNLLKQHVPLDDLGYWLFTQLGRREDTKTLLARLKSLNDMNITPELMYRHINFMAERGLFQGRRTANNQQAVDSVEPENALSSSLVMEYEDGLRHECQACGSCCSATDVGPVDPSTVQAIEEHDWSEDIDMSANDGLFRSFQSGDETVYLTQMKQDQCVFLSSDKKCLIHARLGKNKKPTPCRQFPYVFSRLNNRIQVSLQMECRAYLKAKNAAEHTRTQEADLRNLIESGSPIHSIDLPIRVDDGLYVGLDEYLLIEKTIVSAVRTADFGLGILDPLVGYATGVEAALTELYGPIIGDEQFRSPTSWNDIHDANIELGSEVDPWSKFLQQTQQFETELAGFAQQASVVAEERSLTWLSQRFSVLERTTRAACSQLEPQTFAANNLEGIKTIIADVLVSGILAREPVRQGELRAGLATLGLKAWMTLCGGCQRAKDACRVEVTTQDIIDSMVTISKMLREKAVRDVLEQQKNTLISVFLTNLEVFAQRRAPRLEGPGGIQ